MGYSSISTGTDPDSVATQYRGTPTDWREGWSMTFYPALPPNPLEGYAELELYLDIGDSYLYSDYQRSELIFTWNEKAKDIEIDFNERAHLTDAQLHDQWLRDCKYRVEINRCVATACFFASIAYNEACKLKGTKIEVWFDTDFYWSKFDEFMRGKSEDREFNETAVNMLSKNPRLFGVVLAGYAYNSLGNLYKNTLDEMAARAGCRVMKFLSDAQFNKSSPIAQIQDNYANGRSKELANELGNVFEAAGIPRIISEVRLNSEDAMINGVERSYMNIAYWGDEVMENRILLQLPIKGAYAIEGTDASGKSTILNLLKRKVFEIVYPYKPEMLSLLRNIIGTDDAYNEIALIAQIMEVTYKSGLKKDFQDAITMFRQKVGKHLINNFWNSLQGVFMDRSIFTNLAYAKNGADFFHKIKELEQETLLPEHTFFINVSPATVVKRIIERRQSGSDKVDHFDDVPLSTYIQRYFLYYYMKDIFNDTFHVLDQEVQITPEVVRYYKPEHLVSKIKKICYPFDDPLFIEGRGYVDKKLDLWQRLNV